MKFKEREEVSAAQQESISLAVQRKADELAVAAKAWDRLAAAIRFDVEYYNSHPKAVRRVDCKVMEHPPMIEVGWQGELLSLICIESKPGEAAFGYNARITGHDPRHVSGQIHPASENSFTLRGVVIDAAKLSEELLSPVLFP